MPLFRKRKTLQPNEYPFSKSSPLDIPEILEVILSFLDPYVLKNIAVLVCRQWHRVALSVVPPPDITWDIEKSLQELQDASEDLKNTHTFTIKVNYNPGNLEYLPKFTEFINMAVANQIKITDLTISTLFRTLMFDNDVTILLNFAGWSLRTLRLEYIVHYYIPLDLILEACPRLHTLAFAQHRRNAFNPGKPLFADLENLSTFPTLRSLTLRQIAIDMDPLLKILKSCVNLEELQLKDITKFEQLSKNGRGYIGSSIRSVFEYAFYTKLSASCPKLKKLHLSDTYTPSHYLVTATNMRLLMKAFPSVTDWGFSSNFQNAMLFNEMKPFLQNVITSLKIEGSSSCANNTLHYYLCEAPHLLHLIALGYQFPTDLFDLEGILSRNGDCVGLDSQNCRKIWACRNIKTLRLKFQRDGTLTSSKEIISRIFYGYLSKVCPQLQDLDIDNQHLSLQHDGGFCLLSRLRDLKRIKISNIGQYRPKLSELAWIAKAVSPTLRNIIPIWIAKLKMQESSTYYARTPFHASSNARKFPKEEQTRGLSGDHIIDGVDMSHL
ncbi:hypothetical protein BGZ76_004471, partial [Entomortierella beljakovae]